MDFLKNRFIYFWISWFLLLISIFMLLLWKLNLGIDMTWWINIEYTYQEQIDIESAKSSLLETKSQITYKWNEVINNINSYKVTWENTLVVVAWFDTSIDDKSLDKLKLEFREKAMWILQDYDQNIEESLYTNIGKSFWDYIRNTAFLTLAIAIVAITIYVSFAFSWVISGISVFSFSIITLATLFHDVVISTWLYVFSWIFFKQFQIDTFFVTALLTILGYSINDTIVIFDRIRSNLKMYGGKKWKEWKDLYEIINLSVWQSIKRSIYTSLTLVFVLLTIFLFGPEGVSWFILAMIFGTIIGTYSSIFIAAPILYQVNKNKNLKVYKKQVVNPDDKIVV